MIAIVFGTRPEYIKFKSIIKSFDLFGVDYTCYYVQQHSESFVGIDASKVQKVDIENISGDRLQDILLSVYKNLKLPENTKYVMVQGDTATAFAASLVAFNKKIRILHVEAGLRTFDFDNPFPEEGYRQIIDRISYARFCPTDNDLQNLLKENLTERNFVVGNTVIDELPSIDPSKLDEVYITLHRRENHESIEDWLRQLELLASQNKQTKFILIKHLNPNVSKHYHLLKEVQVIDPVPHSKMIEIIATRASLMISDSGGIQEECSHYNKVVLVCRKATERPYPGSILVDSPSDLISKYAQYKDIELSTRGWFGCGDSGVKICNILKTL